MCLAGLSLSVWPRVSLMWSCLHGSELDQATGSGSGNSQWTDSGSERCQCIVAATPGTSWMGVSGHGLHGRRNAAEHC
jgi:hypothetical protein